MSANVLTTQFSELKKWHNCQKYFELSTLVVWGFLLTVKNLFKFEVNISSNYRKTAKS